jgi:tRNA(Ile)-lysidine synthase
MTEHEIPLLVTAHNANDNLETMLFHLIRGSGLGGMCGIPVSRLCEGGALVRPILGMTRREILDYCQAHHLSYVNDTTNTDTDYTRNRIRSEILPQLTAINPCAVEHAAKLADGLRADHLCLESMARMFLEEMRKGDALETEKINGSPDAIVHRALRELYREVSNGKSLEYTHILALKQLSEKSVPHSSVTLPHGWEAVIEDGWLCFQRKEKLVPAEPFCVPLKNGKNTISQIACEIIMGTSQNTKNIYKNSIQFCMDSVKIKGMLYARNRLPGDRIQMGGMHKSVKKLLGEKKIPLPLRERLPLLCDEDGIVAIPFVGMRDGLAPQQSSDQNITLFFDFSENLSPLYDTEKNRKG